MTAETAPKVALVFDGDVRDPTAWSGTPFGVFSGLRASGVEVVGIDVRLPARGQRLAGLAFGAPLLPRAERSGGWRDQAGRAYSAGLIGPEMAAVKSRLAARRVPPAPLAGIIQIGTGFSVPPVAPIVTYEDMTIRQALDYPYRHWSTLTPGRIERRIALQQRCYDRASGVVLTNSWAAASAVADYGIPDSRVHVAGVGSHEEQRVPTRDWSVPRFLFVGLDWERKNGPRVLAGFRRVREAYPDAELAVVGGHPPLNEPGVTGYGRLRRDDAEDRARLRSLFDAATCFVMPSLFEPSAVVYTEASACGLPAIGTIVGGSEDLVGPAGHSVDPLSQSAVTDAMLDLASPQTAQRLGAVAGDRAALFTWRAVAERLLRAIDPNLLGRPLAAYL